MEQFFKLKENNTSVKIEIRAGLTTFLAMAYIIFVNPTFMAVTGMDSDGAMVATCVATGLGTLLCAFLSNRPFALSTGMGMNAFFTYTICMGYEYSWQQALAIVFLSGILFLICVLVFGDKAVQLIPANLKHAFTVGIGILLSLIGLLNSGIVDMSAGYPAIGNVKSPSVLIAIVAVLVILALDVRHVPGSLLIGMLCALVLSLIFGQTSLPDGVVMMPTAMSKVCMKLSFSGLVKGTGLPGIAAFAAIVVSLSMVDMFDTIGYLIGTGAKANMLDENGNMKDMKKIMFADAGATIMGSLCGTSTVTCFAESSSGIAAGGRTGLTGITVAVCFLISAFFSPIAGMMTAAIAAPALIVVGLYLIMDIKNLNLDTMEDALPALLTVIAVPLTYSITCGIAIGFISYVVCTIAAGHIKKINAGTIVLTLIFLLYFILG